MAGEGSRYLKEGWTTPKPKGNIKYDKPHKNKIYCCGCNAGRIKR